ncbi:MAG: hypothetical protein M0R00_06245 [Candidatus Omnitrophica bacterium]|jgi:hypothetical protein|nr:hypothetical protein [Candidatus Omnitrophota bacterium]
MSNMGYCRFQNTFNDLRDCEEHFDDQDLSEEEHRARIRMYDICKDIVDNFEREDLENMPKEE